MNKTYPTRKLSNTEAKEILSEVEKTTNKTYPDVSEIYKMRWMNKGIVVGVRKSIKGGIEFFSPKE